jgi:hypothetical protein
MAIRCRATVVYHKLCGHYKTLDKHCTESCSPLDIEGNLKCNSILPLEIKFDFVNDRCHDSGCFEQRLVQPTNPYRSVFVRKTIEAYEAQHPEVVRWDRSLENRARHVRETHYEQRRTMSKYDGVHILDLTAPKEKMLKTLASVVRKRGRHTCGVCQELLRDAQMDDQGNPAVIPERGIARRLPCNHVFHIECLVQAFMTNTICPYCRRDDWQVYIFNGTERPAFRHFLEDILQTSGFVPEGGLNKDQNEQPVDGRLKLKPFSSPPANQPDRWGDDNDSEEIRQEEEAYYRRYLDTQALYAAAAKVPFVPTHLENLMYHVADSISAYDDAYEFLLVKQQEDVDAPSLETAHQSLQTARTNRNSLLTELRKHFDASAQQQGEFRAPINRYIRRINEQIASDSLDGAEYPPMLIAEV